jgi:hypothetical protein
MMKFDYCEIENGSIQTLEIIIGCSFEDEPEELYVIQLNLNKDGKISMLKLLFNGMDCKYVFKDIEKASIIAYIDETLPATTYAIWLEGQLYI